MIQTSWSEINQHITPGFGAMCAQTAPERGFTAEFWLVEYGGETNPTKYFPLEALYAQQKQSAMLCMRRTANRLCCTFSKDNREVTALFAFDCWTRQQLTIQNTNRSYCLISTHVIQCHKHILSTRWHKCSSDSAKSFQAITFTTSHFHYSTQQIFYFVEYLLFYTFTDLATGTVANALCRSYLQTRRPLQHHLPSINLFNQNSTFTVRLQ